ncbi:hypothetical protein L2E82_08227 [Cichorium intybus]|uniref:Uncharacterized protein n=1 Tax=Cichorium intybus TaxID=13427 RepID=A0ACB9G736_CICIN|nr:hypothetical protein L2E82_08227 [Cichorium intybus]
MVQEAEKHKLEDEEHKGDREDSVGGGEDNGGNGGQSISSGVHRCWPLPPEKLVCGEKWAAPVNSFMAILNANGEHDLGLERFAVAEVVDGVLVEGCIVEKHDDGVDCRTCSEGGVE